MIYAWGMTDRGTVRPQNQDGFYLDVPSARLAIGVVCDGMGGARAGNIASQMAVETFVDTLQSSEPQQYEYRIDIKVRGDRECKAEEGKPVLASNVLICLDPGHYEGQNVIETKGIRYAEGDFTLELAQEVRKILVETYGITSLLVVAEEA